MVWKTLGLRKTNQPIQGILRKEMDYYSLLHRKAVYSEHDTKLLEERKLHWSLLGDGSTMRTIDVVEKTSIFQFEPA